MPYPCARSHFLKDWDFNDPYIAMIYWFQLNPLGSSKSKKSIEHDYIRIIKVSVFQEMGSSTGVRHERQEVSSTVSPMVEDSTPARSNFFADFFSLIQFWQISQNDLFTENLECLICEKHSYHIQASEAQLHTVLSVNFNSVSICTTKTSNFLNLNSRHRDLSDDTSI